MALKRKLLKAMRYYKNSKGSSSSFTALFKVLLQNYCITIFLKFKTPYYIWSDNPASKPFNNLQKYAEKKIIWNTAASNMLKGK